MGMVENKVGSGMSESRVGIFSPNIVSSVQYNLGGGVGQVTFESYVSPPVFSSSYSYRGYLGCGLLFLSMYSLGGGGRC